VKTTGAVVIVVAVAAVVAVAGRFLF
jgi:hypothetical protein